MAAEDSATINTPSNTTNSFNPLEVAEERRVVTVLFADIVGSTELAEDMDPEELRTLLTRYFQLMADSIHRHGGVVEKFIGDAVLGIFGIPRAHEDDPARAIRAALDMQLALNAFNIERHTLDPIAKDLAMRIGINTGDVVASITANENLAGIRGVPTNFIVTGDAVNVAARFQQVAAPNTIIVGPRTYRYTQGIVEYIPLAAVQLKGKSRPVRVWQATSMIDINPVPLARSRSFDTPRTPIIGRDTELDLLRTIFLRTITDHVPHIVTLLGEAGLGKTRLAKECIAQMSAENPSPIILTGRCALYGEGITFWPMIEIIRDYCDITPATPPAMVYDMLLACVARTLVSAQITENPVEITRNIATTLGIAPTDVALEHRALVQTESTQATMKKVLRAWRTFFAAIAHDTPLIVLIDDIQWADNALLELLENIANPATKAAILLICTARPGGIGSGPSNLLRAHNAKTATDIFQRTGFSSRVSFQTSKTANMTLIELEPITHEESYVILQSSLPNSILPSTLIETILDRAEGNPFFLEEIIRMLIDRGIVKQDELHQWILNPVFADSIESRDPLIPDTVQGVLTARLDLLSPDEREILCEASIIGRSFLPEAILAMNSQMTPERLTESITNLAQKDLIVATKAMNHRSKEKWGEYSFTHILTRDVAYELLPRSRRAHLHEYYAAWLEHFATGRLNEFAESLARHYEEYYQQAGLARSRDSQRQQAILHKVIHYQEMSGDDTRLRNASTAAIRAYSHAISLLLESSEVHQEKRALLIRLLRKRGDARALQSDGNGAWSDYQEALQYWLASPTAAPHSPAPSPYEAIGNNQNEERERGLRLYRRLVLLPTRYPSWFRTMPSHEILYRLLKAGLQLAEEVGDVDSLDRVSLLAARAFFWWSSPPERGESQIREAMASAEEAVDIAERLKAPHHASEALDALGNMQAITTNLTGHLKSQVRRLYWAQQIDDRNELIDIHCEVSVAHQMIGEYQPAIDHAQKALELAQQSENDLFVAQALQRLVIAYFEWDHWPETIQYGNQLITIGPETTISTGNQYRWGVLATAVAYARQGNMDRSYAFSRQLDMQSSARESQYVGVFRGRLRLARGQAADSEHIFRAALAAPAGRHILPALLSELAELGARLGKREVYDEFGEQALTLAKQSGAKKPLAQALRARGISLMSLQAAPSHQGPDLQTAYTTILQALLHFEECGAQWECGRTRYVLAELYRRRGEYDEATHALQKSLALFEATGAVRDIARAKTSLAGGAIHLP